MAVYTQGKSVATSGLPVVAPKEVKAGHEYIWEYWCPAITFEVISPETLTGFMKGLLNLKNYVRQLDTTAADPPLEITGVTIDTKEGRIWIRGKPVAVPTATDPQVMQAGVNPMAIFALIGLVFAVIGAAVSLRFVYEVTGGGGGGSYGGAPALDPCNNPGITNYVTCLARKSSWFAFGALFGVVVLMGYLVVKFGKGIE